MKSSSIFIIIFLISVFISSVSQGLLKKSANQKDVAGIYQYLNFRVMIAYAMFFGATLLTTLAYRGVPLSLGPVIEATGYIYVMVLGYLFLKESITIRKLLGTGIIIAGIVISSLKL